MAIRYDRDDARRLVTATITEPSSIDDFIAVVERQAAEGAWTYALLYDLRGLVEARTDFAAVQRFVDRLQALAPGSVRGPVAAIIPPRPDMLQSSLVTARQTSRRLSFEILLTDAQLDEWLVRHRRR